MDQSLSVFQLMGFFITILSVALFVAVDLILAAFGAAIAWKCFVKGSHAIEADLKRGAEARDFDRTLQ